MLCHFLIDFPTFFSNFAGICVKEKMAFQKILEEIMSYIHIKCVIRGDNTRFSMRASIETSPVLIRNLLCGEIILENIYCLARKLEEAFFMLSTSHWGENNLSNSLFVYVFVVFLLSELPLALSLIKWPTYVWSWWLTIWHTLRIQVNLYRVVGYKWTCTVIACGWKLKIYLY